MGKKRKQHQKKESSDSGEDSVGGIMGAGLLGRPRVREGWQGEGQPDVARGRSLRPSASPRRRTRRPPPRATTNRTNRRKPRRSRSHPRAAILEGVALSLSPVPAGGHVCSAQRDQPTDVPLHMTWQLGHGQLGHRLGQGHGPTWQQAGAGLHRVATHCAGLHRAFVRREAPGGRSKRAAPAGGDAPSAHGDIALAVALHAATEMTGRSLTPCSNRTSHARRKVGRTVGRPVRPSVGRPDGSSDEAWAGALFHGSQLGTRLEPSGSPQRLEPPGSPQRLEPPGSPQARLSGWSLRARLNGWSLRARLNGWSLRTRLRASDLRHHRWHLSFHLQMPFLI